MGAQEVGAVARLARFRIDPARRGDVWSAYSQYAAAVRDESGIQVWELCTDAGDENTIWLYVRADNDSALEAHSSSAATDELRSVLLPAIVGDPVFHDLIPRFVNPTGQAPDRATGGQDGEFRGADAPSFRRRER